MQISLDLYSVASQGEMANASKSIPIKWEGVIMSTTVEQLSKDSKRSTWITLGGGFMSGILVMLAFMLIFGDSDWSLFGFIGGITDFFMWFGWIVMMLIQFLLGIGAIVAILVGLFMGAVWIRVHFSSDARTERKIRFIEKNKTEDDVPAT